MRYSLLISVLLCVSAGVFSQGKSGLDTIYCDIQNTSYVVLPEEVTLVDVGNPQQYAAQIKGNIVFIKPSKENAPPTTILIKSGKEIFYGTLMYNTGAKAKSYYYEIKPGGGKETSAFSLKEIPSNNNSANDLPKDNSASGVSSFDPALKMKMLEFIKIKSEINTLGFISKNVDAAVTVIRNDDTNTYLKLVVKNKSSLPFKLDFISFQYFQDMKKGTLRKSKKAPIDVFPLGEPTIKEIRSGTSQALAYVIPSFALANNGYLMVLVRESSGDRVLKIKVDGSIIQGSSQLNTGTNK